ncbi:MAG TPA: hypothetical protein VL981_14055 [Candidatus Methylacidiphilales bacterium]|nr:hypothetical protein [Candidatus Methylacidiphilales bacterium]
MSSFLLKPTESFPQALARSALSAVFFLTFVVLMFGPDVRNPLVMSFLMITGVGAIVGGALVIVFLSTSDPERRLRIGKWFIGFVIAGSVLPFLVIPLFLFTLFFRHNAAVFERQRMERIVTHVRHFKFKDERELMVTNTATSSGNDTTLAKNKVWAERGYDGSLKVVILATGDGEAGSQGFAYSDTPLQPVTGDQAGKNRGTPISLDLPGPLHFAFPKDKIDNHWWKVSANGGSDFSGVFAELANSQLTTVETRSSGNPRTGFLILAIPSFVTGLLLVVFPKPFGFAMSRYLQWSWARHKNDLAGSMMRMNPFYSQERMADMTDMSKVPGKLRILGVVFLIQGVICFIVAAVL